MSLCVWGYAVTVGVFLRYILGVKVCNTPEYPHLDLEHGDVSLLNSYHSPFKWSKANSWQTMKRLQDANPPMSLSASTSCKLKLKGFESEIHSVKNSGPNCWKGVKESMLIGGARFWLIDEGLGPTKKDSGSHRLIQAQNRSESSVAGSQVRK